jgi:hypothetical protein
MVWLFASCDLNTDMAVVSKENAIATSHKRKR